MRIKKKCTYVGLLEQQAAQMHHYSHFFCWWYLVKKKIIKIVNTLCFDEFFSKKIIDYLPFGQTICQQWSGLLMPAFVEWAQGTISYKSKLRVNKYLSQGLLKQMDFCNPIYLWNYSFESISLIYCFKILTIFKIFLFLFHLLSR